MQVVMVFHLVLSLLLAAGSAMAESASKPNCSKREIERQDCTLWIGSERLRLSSESVVWNNGTWHTVDSIPLKGEGTKWEKMQFASFQGWPILQLWIWDKGAGEAQVQSLNWYVMDWLDRKARVLASGVVRKRRLKPGMSFIYDDWESHGLKLLKNGTLEFALGREKKILERTAHGI